jgi:hypothetical protein
MPGERRPPIVDGVAIESPRNGAYGRLRPAPCGSLGYRFRMPGRAFPVIYARDVEQTASFYEALGFEEHLRLPDDGLPGCIGLRRCVRDCRDDNGFSGATGGRDGWLGPQV